MASNTREYRKRYYAEHREEMLTRSKAYYLTKKEQARDSEEEYQKRYYAKHKEEIIAKNKAYNRKKKELAPEVVVEYQKKYYAEHKEEITTRIKAYNLKKKLQISETPKQSSYQKRKNTRTAEEKAKYDEYQKQYQKAYRERKKQEKNDLKNMLLPPPQFMLDDAMISPDFYAIQIIPPPKEFL